MSDFFKKYGGQKAGGKEKPTSNDQRASDQGAARTEPPPAQAKAPSQGRVRSGDRPSQDDYEVGYGKPPKHTRFGPGNPGRPKGARNKATPFTLSDMVETAMTRRRKVKQGGEIVEMPPMQLMIERLVSMATMGSAREMSYAFKLIDKYLAPLLRPPPQRIIIVYQRAPGATVTLPPPDLWEDHQ